MRCPGSLATAITLSVLLHLVGLVSPPLWAPPFVEPEGEAVRLEARLSSPPPPPAPAPQPVPKHEPAESVIRAEPAPVPVTESAAIEESPLETPEIASESPPIEAPDSGEIPADASAPAEAPILAESSSPVIDEPPAALAAERLPRQGRVRYTGTGGGFISIGVSGEARWEHDGVNLHSRLSAGINSLDGQFAFESDSVLAGPSIVSTQSQDRRMRKHSSARIDQGSGVVYLARGDDRRERTIKGLAVALSALPQAIAVLDESLEKAALFVVGDFWVEDALLVARGPQRLRLPHGVMDTRLYQTRTNNGSQIDIWLAPAWQNAPARIRIEINGWVIDLRAESVEINGEMLLNEPEPEPQ
ncbi:MAG: hypothetical protein CGU28_10130 [Candidatus Dactylopiibacterium carminicum]|uniref:DUF3108 domain-containing protein n=1 Tax=Candidatus Dactylopiibacterium carminicum TaxID=857335 RepID=A0A272ER27_9RHOO|nr:hypothetical protein [Candidatus Dactylopiibacterium carminicum]KAF7598679.1 hypothetical protein BGI27_12095 [Candidatus Dactylopiibacterium carminicum]PAS92569.1 MAG: hypothetical protein CGU29_11175 [Candidatus Dactylopiibacterium carminicum]PAS96072.1 MAG: hypothetical protein CGU28_10130 [Candidatus Dactylopiibacterium carminicum]PAS98546.1 MAG: hypothetical protein BSR46_12110 [Candidatus Dactylopiibacterium carminicum]